MDSNRLLIGLLLGLGFGAMCGASGGYAYLVKLRSDAQRGWSLTPVMVAAHPLAAGAEVTRADLAERPIPEQFVTSSVVRSSDLAKLSGRRTIVAVENGEPLTWSALVEPHGCQLFLSACADVGVPVLVAKHALTAGTPIFKDVLEKKVFPRELVNASWVTDDTFSGVEGEHLLFPLEAGDPLFRLDVSGRETCR